MPEAAKKLKTMNLGKTSVLVLINMFAICFRNGTEHVEDESHLICDCPAYNNLEENLDIFETLNDKMQLTYHPLFHDIQTFTVLNPDSSEC